MPAKTRQKKNHQPYSHANTPSKSQQPLKLTVLTTRMVRVGRNGEKRDSIFNYKNTVRIIHPNMESLLSSLVHTMKVVRDWSVQVPEMELGKMNNYK